MHEILQRKSIAKSAIMDRNVRLSWRFKLDDKSADE